MGTIPRISETEWDVMRVLWKRAPLTANEIVEALQQADASWHPKTAKTLVNRLIKKRAVGVSKTGRVYRYRPLVREKDCVDAVAESFLGRVFGGSLAPMLAHFVEEKKLSASELEDLRALLDRSGEGGA